MAWFVKDWWFSIRRSRVADDQKPEKKGARG